MFIYADESGHSGRHIFNDPLYYLQGAILSVVDTEPLLNPIAEKYRMELGVERLHANELRPYIIERIGSAFLEILKGVNWSFHLTIIEKPYLSVTKFVDTIFDSYENKGARWLWYNVNLFRHVLCCLFDQLLSHQNKKDFWKAYLKDDSEKINLITKIALENLDKIPIDQRLYQVARDGLYFALKYPEEITLMASTTKKSYKGHTPNMIAFASLIQAVHKFCKENDVIPKSFIHDPQSEFGATMREYHMLLAKLRAEHSKSGMLIEIESVDYDLGKFSLTPSKQLSSLQAVDIFLWLSQRQERIKSEGLKRALTEKTDPYYISRASSEASALIWLHKLNNTEFTEEQIKSAKKMIENLEKKHFEKLDDFVIQKFYSINGKNHQTLNKIEIERASDEFYNFAWINLSPKDRAKVMRDFPKTVWIFGAGASHHYDLNSRGVPMPLSDGFFKAFHELPTSEGYHAHVGPLISFLLHNRNVRIQELSNWTENIEDFMTSIENELNELRDRKDNQKLDDNEIKNAISLATVFNNMNFIFANVLNEAQNGPSTSVYRYLLDICGPNDAFITFNWDTLLDRALADTGGWTPNDGYGFSFSSIFDGTWKNGMESAPLFSTKWKLLKLHGSTNWLVPYLYVHLDTLEFKSLVPESDNIFLYWQSTLAYETFKARWRGGYAPTCYCYYPPNLPEDDFKIEQLSAGEGRSFIAAGLIQVFSPFKETWGKGVPSSPLLITPVRQKRYDIYQSTIEDLWQQAKGVLERAEKIVIIGYSFPATDTRPLELLRDTLNYRDGQISIEIVAPGVEDIAHHIGKKYLSKAKDIITHPVKFEEYLEKAFKHIPTLMKGAAERNVEVKDWLKRIYSLGAHAVKMYGR